MIALENVFYFVLLYLQHMQIHIQKNVSQLVDHNIHNMPFPMPQKDNVSHNAQLQHLQIITHVDAYPNVY